MKFFTKTGIILASILLLSAVLRLYKLGEVPSSMNADEVAIGYNAYSILKTGRDEYNQKLPMLFRSFDDYKLPAYIYLTVPSIAVFGLNDAAVRLPSALLGVLTVIALYYLIRGLYPEDHVLALISSFLLAVSPWHLHFSRSAYEANVAVFFLTAGMALLVHALRKPLLFIPGFITLSLSVWSYHSPRIFVPLLIFIFTVVFFPSLRKFKRIFFIGLVLFIILVLPLFYISFSSTGLVRARGVSALDDPVLTSRNALWRLKEEKMGIPFANIFHNQRLVNASIIVKGYLEHFNPNFFVSEVVRARYRAPGMGLLYFWELPFLFIGLLLLIKNKEKGKWLVLSWFFLAPVAAAPTQMLPHPVRTLIFLPSIQIITAFGLRESIILLHRKKRKFYLIALVLGVIMITLSLWFYLRQYFIHLQVDYASEWQYGHEQVVHNVKLMEDKFDKVVVSTTLDQPYIFFLYYLKYDPQLYQLQGGTISGKFDEERNRFGKYEFHTYMDSETSLLPGILYVGTPSEVLSGSEKLLVIPYPSGEPAYTISGEISKKVWNDSGYQPYLP